MSAPFPVSVSAEVDPGKAVIVCNDSDELVKACEALLLAHKEVIVRKVIMVTEHPTIKMKGES